MTLAGAFHRGWRPGLIGAVTALHGRTYAEVAGFGALFEARVAAGLGAFFERYDAARDLTLSAWDESGLLGTVTIDGAHPRALGEMRLRWFVVDARGRGLGLGRRLLAEALAFADEARRPVALDTFAGLDAARRLYEGAGFSLEREAPGDSYGSTVTEQRFWRSAAS